MTTERALMAAVLESPDDDLPRLVLADWWEENGRAEEARFVRDAVYAHRHPHCQKRGAPVSYFPRCRCGTCSAKRRLVGKPSRDRRNHLNARYVKPAVAAWWLAEVPVPPATVPPWVTSDCPDVDILYNRGLPGTVICNPAFARHGLEAVVTGWPVGLVVVGGRIYALRHSADSGNWAVTDLPRPFRWVRSTHTRTRAEAVAFLLETVRRDHPPRTPTR